MSSLMVAYDSHIMMLEFVVEKLFVPSTSPFDAVIMSKYIASFRLLDHDWIDVMPNRLDYEKYRGSSGPQQLFHGGKSLVFSVPSSFLATESLDNLPLEIRARREISRYFEAEEHCREIGAALVDVGELLDGIVTELRLRRELDGCLRLAHERDPISRSMKGTFDLLDPTTSIPTESQLDLYLRLSYLGSSLVTEIDRPSVIPYTPIFFAQEETNLGSSALYECSELRCTNVPSSASPRIRPSASIELECVCTDEQKYALLMGEGTRTICTEAKVEDQGEKKQQKKKKTKKKKDMGTDTEPEQADKGVDTSDSQRRKKMEAEDAKRRLNELTDEDLARLIRSKRRGGGATVGIVDKGRKTCEPEPPCCPADICIASPVDCCLPMACPVPDAGFCCYN